MNTQHNNNFNQLCDYTLRLCTEFKFKDAYPVLGAEGKNVTLDIYTDDGSQCTLIYAIYINFGAINLPEISTTQKESIVFLPDFSYLIGLIGIMEVELQQKCQINHPLTINGDPYQEWYSAITF